MFAGEGRGRARVDSKVERGGDIRHAGKVYGLVAFGPSDIDQQLLRNRVGDGIVVGEDGAIECRRRKAACEAENGQEADKAAEPSGVNRAAHGIESTLMVHHRGSTISLHWSLGPELLRLVASERQE